MFRFSSTVAVERRYSIQTPSPQHSYSDTSPRSSPYSDNTSSTSDCDSEPDQVSTHCEQPPRKKRQRTTFSPIEVWELERAYRRRPYLMGDSLFLFEQLNYLYAFHFDTKMNSFKLKTFLFVNKINLSPENLCSISTITPLDEIFILCDNVYIFF